MEKSKKIILQTHKKFKKALLPLNAIDKAAIGIFTFVVLIVLPTISISRYLLSANASFSTIVLKASNVEYNGGSTSFTLPKPITCASGDILLAQIVTTQGVGLIITPPAGWSLVRRDNNTALLSSGIYLHVAGTMEPSSYTWNFNTSVAVSGGIDDFSGVSTNTPIDTSSGSFGNSTSVMGTSVSTRTPEDLVIFFGATNNRSSIIAPANMSTKWSVSTNATTAYMADMLVNTEGPTGNETAAVQSGSAYATLSQVVALLPVVSGITPTPVAN